MSREFFIQQFHQIEPIRLPKQSVELPRCKSELAAVLVIDGLLSHLAPSGDLAGRVGPSPARRWFRYATALLRSDTVSG